MVLAGYTSRGDRCGETHYRAKLSDDQVWAIRAAAERRESIRAIAARFGCSRSQVHNIVRYRQRVAQPHEWRHLPESGNGCHG